MTIAVCSVTYLQIASIQICKLIRGTAAATTLIGNYATHNDNRQILTRLHNDPHTANATHGLMKM